MAYTRENFLNRVIEVQEAFESAKKHHARDKYQGPGGYNKRRIYKREIKQRFHISYRTFDKYLKMDAQGQLTEIKSGK
jgi:hypothetical protein